MKRFILPTVFLLYAVSLFFIQAGTFKYFSVDWHETYFPAVTALLEGRSPYEVTTLHNPVWGLFPLIPFSLIGEEAGAFALFLTAFFVYVWVALRLGASRMSLVFLVLSPLFIYNLMIGNIDWLVSVGFVLPPPFCFFFLALKPQIGIAPALYWVWVTYKRDGWKAVIKGLYPVVVCLAVTFIVYGNWLAARSDNVIYSDWNMSLFPWSIPVGLLMVYMARNKINWHVSASPFFSPYLSLGSWSIFQIGAVENPMIVFLITALLWVFFIAGRFLGY